MARNVLTLQQIDRDGIAPAYVAGNATDGHEFSNVRQLAFLHVKNGGASPVNVTAITPNQVDGLDIADRVIAVPAGGERMIGPFSNDLYGSGTNKTDVYIDLSADTSVTLGAFIQAQG